MPLLAEQTSVYLSLILALGPLVSHFNKTMGWCRTILRCSSGTPKPSLYWQTGSLKVQNLLLQKKLNFYHHFANLPADSLAGEFFIIQSEKELEIVKELKEHIEKMGNINPKEVSKWYWKKKTKLYIEDKNRREILQDIQNLKKNSTMINW